jgi:putative membrane protein
MEGETMASFTTRRATGALLLAALLLPSTLLVGCERWPGNKKGGGAGGGVMGQKELTEAQALGIARALNQGEVDHARAVVDRLTSADAKGFAEMMIQDHGAALQAIEQTARSTGITPADSDQSRDLAKDVQDKIDDLRKEQGPDLDKKFLDQQKELHEDALKTIDDDLVPAARNDAVRQLFVQNRATVAGHLDRLHQLQGTDSNR